MIGLNQLFSSGKELRYDLHVHSCLSPCADSTMTPNNIVNMALVSELDIISVTDHNSADNLPAFAKLAQEKGLGFVPGIEVCTAEDIHLLCYFPSLQAALDFSSSLYPTLPSVLNRPDLFGLQEVRDRNDTLLRQEEKLLINASSLNIAEMTALASHHGVCMPAHIDKNSNSMLSVLGSFPPDYSFRYFEAISPEALLARPDATSILQGREYLVNSDAHYLHEIGSREQIITSSHSFYSFLQNFILGR